MTTLALLKSTIARDLGTSSRTTEIASAIGRAIKKHQKEHFWFNESRSATFTTIVDQVYYSVTDNADIGLIRKLEGLVIETASHDYPLSVVPHLELELYTDANSSSGEPSNYCYYDQKIGVYPKPDDAYTIRMFGVFALAEPANDAEADNAWMVEGFNLIRATAEVDLFYGMRNPRAAGDSEAMESRELKSLRTETRVRLQTGRVKTMYL
jgi:hypothetical protein